MWACGLRYPACNAQMPARLHNICLHYLIKDTIFGRRRRRRKKKKLLNTKCVFWFSLKLLSETFLIRRGTERDMIINVYWSSCKVMELKVKWITDEIDEDESDVYWTVHHCDNWRIRKPTRCHLIFYCTSYRLNMFQALLCPSSGARDYDVVYHIGRFVRGLLYVGG